MADKIADQKLADLDPCTSAAAKLAILRPQ